MRKFSTFASPMLLLCVVITVRVLVQGPPVSSAGGTQDVGTVMADVVATGIPGAGAITHIGTFHKGGPFVERPLFAPETQPGRVLDPVRLFVASTSNFGAPLARPDETEGSILSIDVTGAPIAVPVGFASAGGQASALGGAVILYTAQSPAFINSANGNTGAVTASPPAVSLPLGISLNNGFGRPWFANAPDGSDGDGTLTVNGRSTRSHADIGPQRDDPPRYRIDRRRRPGRHHRGGGRGAGVCARAAEHACRWTVGRFGWKAQTPTLVEFMGEAFRDESGLTNPLAAHDLVSGCGAAITNPEADAAPLTSLVAFLNTIDPLSPSSATLAVPGRRSLSRPAAQPATSRPIASWGARRTRAARF